MKKHQCLIKQGFAQAEIAKGLKVTLSRPVTKPVMVVMYPADSDEPVRHSQRKLARMWATDEAKSGVGEYETADDCYWYFKVRFLAPVLAVDDEDFAQAWETLAVYTLMGQHKQYRLISDAMVHISDSTMSQTSEALRQYQQYMNLHSIPYRDPADYKAALQIEWHKAGGNL